MYICICICAPSPASEQKIDSYMWGMYTCMHVYVGHGALSELTCTHMYTCMHVYVGHGALSELTWCKSVGSS